METKYGFTKMTLSEFRDYLADLKVARTILSIQEHHTYSPNYTLWEGDNHFALQKGMKNFHVSHHGWSNIGQHFTTFPDGTVLTGRSLESTPACILGANANAICIENLGNFDQGGDQMTDLHKEAIVGITAALCEKFSVPVNADKIVYHHWFKLSNGERNNGSGGNKSCPGTNFFGGNKVEHAEAHFLPLVNALVTGNANGHEDDPDFIKYVIVTANAIAIREGADADTAIPCDRPDATLGAVLRVFGEQNGWYKISSSKFQWVSARNTRDVRRATVVADSADARIAPMDLLPATRRLPQGEVVFIERETDKWAKIAMEDSWLELLSIEFS